MPKYDGENFAPPAPVAQVSIRNAATGAVATVSMLIDSGADTTLLPRAAVESLEIPALEAKYLLEAFDGTISESEAVRAKVVFLGRTFTGQFLVVDGDVGVIGRNVLNRVRILLDGPEGVWRETT